MAKKKWQVWARITYTASDKYQDAWIPVTDKFDDKEAAVKFAEALWLETEIGMVFEEED